MLMRHDRPHDARAVHDVEAFGPVSTLMPYKELEEAVALAARGKGSLCCSITNSTVKRQPRLFGRPLPCTVGSGFDRECAKESQDTAPPCPCSFMEDLVEPEAAKKWEVYEASDTTCNEPPFKDIPPC